MAVTVKYIDGTAQVFASEQDALAQVTHDNTHPNNINPEYILDGDLSQNHRDWIDFSKVLLHDYKTVSELRCECVECEFNRQIADLPIDRGGDKRKLYEEIYRTKIGHDDILHAKGVSPIRGGAVPGAGVVINSAAFAPGAATTKTAVSWLTGSNTPVDLIELGVSTDATSGNLLIEITLCDTTATGTAGATTGAQVIRGPTQALNASYGTSYSAEPTVQTRAKAWRYPMPGGPFVIQAPLGRELNSVTATASGKRVCVRVTPSVAANIDTYIEVEE